MENRRRRSRGSGDMFSFPSTPTQDQDSDFEFGSITPDSPSSDPYKNSPADHVFFNGRLLPHAFPIQPANRIIDNSRSTTSRTSSISSKDSLRSSRSNSTNSRSSSCSSARTSSSDNSERKLLYKTTFLRDRYHGNKVFSAQAYGSSQRWQYITHVPVLSRESSRRKKVESMGKEVRTKKQTEKRKGASSWFGWKFLWWFVSACKECHAMEPSMKDDVLGGKT
ncbi:Membrane-associated kinase regulator [Fagus crenata]